MQRRLQKHHPDVKSEHVKLGTSKFTAHRLETSYQEYVHNAFRRLGITSDHPEWPSAEVLEAEWTEAWDAERSKFRLFYLMQEALAPLVEALIVLDRALFAEELLCSAGRRPVVRIWPIFDPTLSPRNLALYAGIQPNPLHAETGTTWQ